MKSQVKVQQNTMKLMSQQKDGNNNSSNSYHCVGMPLINNMNLVRSREMVAMATELLILLLTKKRPKKGSRYNNTEENFKKNILNNKKIIRFLLGLE